MNPPQIYFFVTPRPGDYRDRLWTPPQEEQYYIEAFRNAGYEVLVDSDVKTKSVNHLEAITWNIGDLAFTPSSELRENDRPFFLCFFNQTLTSIQWDVVKYEFGKLFNLDYFEPRRTRFTKDIGKPLPKNPCLFQPEWEGFSKIGDFNIKQCI